MMSFSLRESSDLLTRLLGESDGSLIFISAVSQELRSARQLVANTLTFLGYDPIWQDIFGTSEGDLLGVLRKQISRCNGVVQLVGCCYGAEPPQPTEEFGRVSYTQYEALYTRKIGKKVWYRGVLPTGYYGAFDEIMRPSIVRDRLPTDHRSVL